MDGVHVERTGEGVAVGWYGVEVELEGLEEERGTWMGN